MADPEKDKNISRSEQEDEDLTDMDLDPYRAAPTSNSGSMQEVESGTLNEPVRDSQDDELIDLPESLRDSQDAEP